ncbi:MAG: hypothetical protein DHS20C10_00680 [marine bacterium B5-7]|nr:MAG: hypothetical protein DHS20C10_00680 [marine bacterium B5-7]
MKRILLISLVSLLMSNVQAATDTRIQDLQSSYQFLVNTHDKSGALYQGKSQDLNERLLPLSYYDNASYWGEYVCQLAGNNCTVTDDFNITNYALEPHGDGADLQMERANVHNGTDIYDAATWQIAVMLGQVNHGFTNAAQVDAYQLANNQNVLLQVGYDGVGGGDDNSNRAVTNEKASIFYYNGHKISSSDANQAYFFRMVSKAWFAADPLYQSDYTDYIQPGHMPDAEHNKDHLYHDGEVTWADWKPITGENAWAFLVGPLQAAYLHYYQQQGDRYVPVTDAAMKNALAILPTFARMQSTLGGVYYAVQGSLGNQGDEPVNPHQVSVENNMSLYGGLQVLKHTLEDTFKNQPDLTTEQRAQLQQALHTIDVMVDGGQLDGYDKTAGMLSFFQHQAWHEGEFLQGGLANDSNQSSDWVPTLEPRAVDVNTWGIAALGPKQIDAWFGFGASYQAWQQVKSWGAYGEGKTLWGVGYSDKDGNGVDASGNFKQGIMSAEWTAGAINAVRVMTDYYQKVGASDSNYAKAQQLLTGLKADEANMVTHVQQLRYGQYSQVGFPGTPASFQQLLPLGTAPYLYASKRYMIPFGWYANPIPSTCSTSWMLMVADHFNPFVFGGKSNATAA